MSITVSVTRCFFAKNRLKFNPTNILSNLHDNILVKNIAHNLGQLLRFSKTCKKCLTAKNTANLVTLVTGLAQGNGAVKCSHQGDQIHQFFALWVIVYFSQLLIERSCQHFWATFVHR
jgi:hypothetical protein